MKTLKIYIIVLLSVLTLGLNAQIKVISSGNVGIGINNPLQKLHVNGSIRGDQTAGLIQIQTDYGYTKIGALNTSFSHFYTNSSNFYFEKGIDIRTGKLTSYDNVDLSLCTGSQFYTKLIIKYSSGYVGIGNYNPSYMLDVDGDIRADDYHTTSDVRLKTDIKNLPEDAVKNLFYLNAKTYKRLKENQRNEINTSNDTINRDIYIDPKLVDKTRIGFIAQELKEYFPDLVEEDNSGYLSINYVGLIPVIVEALKNQEEQIEALKTQLASNDLKSTSFQTKELTSKGALEQNIPNPFNQSTKINYYLPDNTINAVINIYDMNGLQIKSLSINSFGKGTVIIYGSELHPGMYFYTLLADGAEIDTKRMILTE